MEPQLFNLLLTVGVTAFLGAFLWMWLMDSSDISLLKRSRLVLKMIVKGRTYDTLCDKHAIFVLKRKGQMALVDNSRCNKCKGDKV